MKQLNKKAIRNTAIFPMAKVTNLVGLVKSKITKKSGLFNLNYAAKIIGISADDCKDFLELRQYIKKELFGYSATGMGVEFGYVINVQHEAFLTTKGLERVASAFSY